MVSTQLYASMLLESCDGSKLCRLRESDQYFVGNWDYMLSKRSCCDHVNNESIDICFMFLVQSVKAGIMDL